MIGSGRPGKLCDTRRAVLLALLLTLIITIAITIEPLVLSLFVLSLSL